MTSELWELDPRGHVWKLDERGNTDVLAYEVEAEEGFFGGHNGPVCIKCGFYFCMYCHPGVPDEECPYD